MRRWFTLFYGLLAYAAFFASFVYAVAFVGDFESGPLSQSHVPYTINFGRPMGLLRHSVMVNVGLLALFGLQHSIMARPAFKRMWTKIVPREIERSTFVLATSACLGILFYFWQPIPIFASSSLTGPLPVWRIDAPTLGTILRVIAACGWAIVVVSTFLIDHWHLFGLRQTLQYWSGKPPSSPAFRMPWLYRRVRHPLMLGFLIAFWVTPKMSAGHLLFAGVTTLYILVAIQLEERDLIATHGDEYRSYRRRVPMLIPWRWSTSSDKGDGAREGQSTTP